ncbi:hypothetical protein [Mucilaginibacter sp. 22184]|uniref:hypothetical protein n=1 Tax=Mucilaginibacter sp. 22184 TaxID=3453887 RepID=UPI003F877095
MIVQLNFNAVKIAEHGKFKIPYGIYCFKSEASGMLNHDFLRVPFLFIPYGIFSFLFQGILQLKGEKDMTNPDLQILIDKGIPTAGQTENFTDYTLLESIENIEKSEENISKSEDILLTLIAKIIVEIIIKEEL